MDLIPTETGRNGKNGRFEHGNQLSVKHGPNKISFKVKEAIVAFLEDNTPKIQESFDKLKPIQKLKFIAEILPYATPKLASIQVEQETKLSGGITITWEEPDIRQDQSSTPEL